MNEEERDAARLLMGMAVERNPASAFTKIIKEMVLLVREGGLPQSRSFVCLGYGGGIKVQLEIKASKGISPDG